MVGFLSFHYYLLDVDPKSSEVSGISHVAKLICVFLKVEHTIVPPSSGHDSTRSEIIRITMPEHGASAGSEPCILVLLASNGPFGFSIVLAETAQDLSSCTLRCTE
jgi:hypothetical protein